jgi:hypothetical protein
VAQRDILMILRRNPISGGSPVHYHDSPITDAF